MTGRIEVLKSVCVLRILAASDVATGEADAKLIPLLAKRDAFLAAARPRRDLLDLAYMFAIFSP
jgi:hypothetical protein